MARKDLRRKGLSIRILPQHLTITGALALALCLVGLLGAAGSEPAYAVGEDYIPDQVIVKLNPLLNTHIDEINADYGTDTLDRSLASMDIYLLKLPENSNEETFAERLAKDPDLRVDYAEPNFVAEAPEADARHRARVSNSPVSEVDSSHRYAIRNLNLSCEERDMSLGRGVTVAVLDTGAQLDHPRLAANFSGVKRYDFVDDDMNPTDVLDKAPSDGRRDLMAGHGTHVAGIVDRVAPGAKIMPLRVLNSRGVGDAFTIAKAVSYAQRNGAKVINLSLGSSGDSDLLKEMIRNAIIKGTVVVAAAGNTGSNANHYPAAGYHPLPTQGLLAVTSVTSSGDDDLNELKSEFSTYGLWVDVSAPGEEIHSTFPEDKYATWSGTSMATPFVSGQAALIRALDGSLDPAGIEGKIRDSAQKDFEEFYAKNGEYSLQLGAGPADVCRSLEG